MRDIPVLYIVIPCYNEANTLPVTAPLFLNKIQELIERNLVQDSSRILFVDDGSKDDTWQIISTLAKNNKYFAGIAQSRNRGHQNAVLAGLMESKDKCDITISIDCDGQDDLNAMNEMVKKYLEGFDVVYGVRNDRSSDTFFKRFTAEAFYKLLRVMGVEVVFNHADYRLLSARVAEELGNFKEVNIYLRGMIPLIGFSSTEVYYERHERMAGKSHYPLTKMLELALNGITSLIEYQANPYYFINRSGGIGSQFPDDHLDVCTVFSASDGAGMGKYSGYYLSDGWTSADLSGRAGRIHRQDLYGDEGPSALYYQQAH